MPDIGAAWSEVGSQLNGLAMKLKLHYEQASSGSSEEAREALNRLRDALDDAFGALGNAAKDDAIRDDVRRLSESIGDALSTTFAEVGDEFRRAFRRSPD
jgi:hypothetical protein